MESIKMKKDINDERDIVLLVNKFYEAVRKNETIGYIFNDAAKVNWDNHLPKMYAFWSGILLGKNYYFGNPIKQHIAISQKVSLTETEFDEWLLLWSTTVDELFEGNKAQEAKLRAKNIATLMLQKIKNKCNIHR